MLFPALGLGGLNVLSQSYGNSIIFLFLSGFLLALALERWAVHERVAIAVLARFKGGANEFVGLILGMTAFLSMWISNTAAAILMLPIATSSLRLFETKGGGHRPIFSRALYLSIAFGASIGGIGTVVGSPPNALLASFLARTGQPKISFLDYLAMGLPLLAILLPLAWWLLTRTFGRLEQIDGKITRTYFRAELASLPKLSSAQKRVAMVFVGVASLWVLGPLLPFRLDDASIGIGGAILLFFLSSGEPKSADSQNERCLDFWVIPRIPWDVLILFGGGIAVSETFQSSGLSALLGQLIHSWGEPPLWLLLTVLVSSIIMLTELASNTAVAAAFLPVAFALAEATGHPPLALGFPVAMAASLSFMLPVATPPNALVYASGKVSAGDMIRIGWRMNLVSAVVIIMFSLLFLA